MAMTVQELKNLLDEYTESLGVDPDEEVRVAFMQSYTNLSISIDDVDQDADGVLHVYTGYDEKRLSQN